MDDSPPPFIIFRESSHRPRPSGDVYAIGLELVSAIEAVCDGVPGRYPLKKQLEKQGMQIVMELARMKLAPRRDAWRGYRHAQSTAIDVAAMLDILGAQVGPNAHVEAANALAKQLLVGLLPLSLGS